MTNYLFEHDYEEDGKELNLFLTGDWHFDDRACDRNLLKQDLELAKSQGAWIIVLGDLLNYYGLFDKRRVRGTQADSDAALTQAMHELIEFLEPYAANLRLLCTGNHEVTAIKAGGGDPVHHLWWLWKRAGHNQIRLGGYEGMARIRFTGRTKDRVSSGATAFDFYWNHGQGSSAEITLGMIDLKRREHIEADLIALAHKHTVLYAKLNPRIGINKSGNLYFKKKVGVVVGTYSQQSPKYDIEKIGYQVDYGTEKMRRFQNQRGMMINIQVCRDQKKRYLRWKTIIE